MTLPRETLGASSRSRSAQRSLGSIVLGCEVILVFLGALTVFGLKVLPAPLALGGGGLVVLALMVTIPLLRFRWGYVVGWALHVIIVASGFLVGMMFVAGALFTALWCYCMITGARLDRVRSRALS